MPTIIWTRLIQILKNMFFTTPYWVACLSCADLGTAQPQLVSLSSCLCIWFLSSLLFLIHCGICTKQEMKLLPWDLTPCHLHQFFINLSWGSMYGINFYHICSKFSNSELYFSKAFPRIICKHSEELIYVIFIVILKANQFREIWISILLTWEVVSIVQCCL